MAEPDAAVRIALVVPTLRGGGIPTVLLVIARGLAERGHAVYLVVFNRSGELDGRVPGNVRLVDLDTRKLVAALPKLVAYGVASPQPGSAPLAERDLAHDRLEPPEWRQILGRAPGHEPRAVAVAPEPDRQGLEEPARQAVEEGEREPGEVGAVGHHVEPGGIRGSRVTCRRLLPAR